MRRGRGGERGPGGTRVHVGVIARCEPTLQRGEPATQFVHWFVTAQSRQRRRQPVTLGDQFAAPFGVGARIGHIRDACAGQHPVEMVLRGFERGLRVGCGRAGNDACAQYAGHLDVGDPGDGEGERLVRRQRDRAVLHHQLQIGGRREFDSRRGKFGETGRPVHRPGRYLDVSQHRIRHRVRRDLVLGPVPFGARDVDLREPGRQSVGLVTIRQPVEPRASRVGAGLRVVHRGAGSLGRRRGDVTNFGCDRLVLSGKRRLGFQVGDRLDALVDVGAQPSSFGQRRRRRVGRCLRCRGNDLRLLQFGGERGDDGGCRAGGGEALLRRLTLRVQLGEPLRQLGVPAHTVVDLGDCRGAVSHLFVGRGAAGDRRRPLPCRAPGGGEVPRVLVVDAVDQEGLVTREGSRLAGGHVERTR